MLVAVGAWCALSKDWQAHFPMISWQGAGSTGRSSFSALQQRLFLPWWKVMLSPTLKSCLEIAVLGGFLTVLRVAPVKELLFSEMLQPKAVSGRLLLC